MKKKYVFLEHTADIKIRSYGSSVSEVFENITLAISEYLGRGSGIRNEKKRKINLKAENIGALLYNYIDELIYLLDAEEFIVNSADLYVKGNKLSGIVYGDDSNNYKDLDHIKASTYSEMYIKQKGKGKWEGQVVVDV